jgi:spermidine/putrescine ABC transporter ATP-binding subunit
MTMADGSAIISIRGVTKRFGASVIAVDDVSLDIRAGEFFALLGPSGCGKTTLLRMIAGFETPSEGAILIDGEDMFDVEPNRRPVNMVFQSYAVFPHMTVAQNIAYGLRVVGTPRGEIARRVEEAIALVRLEGLEERKPDKLSGGQRQRVALARALVKKPKVLLLDEPLSALDAKLREAMQMELVNLQHSVGITFIIVTHDQHEALSMADRIAVMGDGRVLQVAPPMELYEYPSSTLVADFIGQVNLFPVADSEARDGGVTVTVGELGEIVLSGPKDRVTHIAVRPEKVRLAAAEPGEPGLIKVKARVRNVSYSGDQSHVFLETPGGLAVSARVQNTGRALSQVAGENDELWLSWRPEDVQPLAD